MIIDQIVLLIQIIIFFVFVKKIKNGLDSQMNVEMRLYGYSMAHYRSQIKIINNLKFVLKFYALFKVITLIYAILNFILNKGYSERDQINER